MRFAPRRPSTTRPHCRQDLLEALRPALDGPRGAARKRRMTEKPTKADGAAFRAQVGRASGVWRATYLIVVPSAADGPPAWEWRSHITTFSTKKAATKWIPAEAQALGLLKEELCVVWSNAPARVYHGTTLTAAKEIRDYGPDPTRGSAVADFGLGFYVTTSLHQAQQWANQKVRKDPRGTHVAALVSFYMDRDLAGSFKDHLSFVIADKDFHDFVLYNRLLGVNHGPSRSRPYDVIYGPVAAYPQTIIYTDCDQICFSAGSKAISSLGSSSVSASSSLFP